MVVRLCEEKGLTHELEYLTWESAMTEISLLVGEHAVPQDSLFFVNSIGDQQMTRQETDRLLERFGHLMPRVVL